MTELKCPKCGHLYYIKKEVVRAMIKREMAKRIKESKSKGGNMFEIIEEIRRQVEKLPNHRKMVVPAKILRLVPKKPTNRNESED